MKASIVAKASATLAAAATLSLSVGGGAFAAGPTASQEDPTTNGYLVGVGSDTIQDVLYGFSQDFGTQPDGLANLTSWTATGTGNFTTRSGVTVVPSGATAGQAIRPNGSGGGYKALLDSIGVTSGVSGFNAGDVDFSRASGTQGTLASGTSGVTTDIPFAIDALSTAVPAGSPFLKTNGGNGLSIDDLVKIYSSQVNEVNTSTGALGKTTAATPDAGSVFIQAFLPKPGSGSRQFFLGQLAALDPTDFNLTANGSTKGDGLFTTAGTPAASAPYVGAVQYDGTAVQEHDATILTNSTSKDVAAIAPFSAAKFIGYHNGLIADPDAGKTAGTDYALVPFASTVTGAPASGVLPYTDNSGTYVPNAAYKTYATKGTEKASFSLTREVYNIIPTTAWKNPNANAKYRALYDTFVGAGSKVCLDTKTITAYGFLTDPNCGSTAKTYDSYSSATLTVSNTAAVAGGKTDVTVAVQSVGNGGGKVTITIDGTEYTGTIAATTPGTTPSTTPSVTFTVPTPDAGTITYGGGANDGFTPNLAGVAPAAVQPGTLTVSKAAPKVTATAPTVSHTKAGKVNVTVTATGVQPTGTVTVVVKKGTKTVVTVANKALVNGKVAVTLTKKLAAGSYTVFVAYSGDDNVNSTTSTKVATLKVT